jgi:hypothetical protein
MFEPRVGKELVVSALAIAILPALEGKMKRSSHLVLNFVEDLTDLLGLGECYWDDHSTRYGIRLCLLKVLAPPPRRRSTVLPK